MRALDAASFFFFNQLEKELITPSLLTQTLVSKLEYFFPTRVATLLSRAPPPFREGSISIPPFFFDKSKSVVLPSRMSPEPIVVGLP